MKQINNLNEALELLNTNILIASNYNIKRIFFMKSNNKILVINENIKCYIKEKYNNIFIVETLDKKVMSFTYGDIITKTIIIDYL